MTCYGALEVAKAGSGLCSARTPVFRLGFAPTVTACLCLVIVTSLPALVRVFKRIKQARQSSGKHGLIRHLCISTWILTLPFVYAFGSGLTPYRQASLAVIFCIIAAIVNIASAESKASRRAGLMVILVFTIALTARTISDSYQLPYRQTSIANQTQPIRIGVHKALLHIEPEIANKLTDLLSQAERAGWKAGTPLVGAVWRWASTVPYFLGAEVPDSLLLTIFGYPASPDVARDRIRRLGAFPSRAAWILTSCPESVDLKQSEEIRELFDSFEHVSGQAFPTDYLLVAKSGTLELWRPKETSTP